MSDPVILELREQFATPDQQRQTASIGMWIFLTTEVMLFGGLFTAYTMYRLSNPHGFDTGSAHMTIVLGSVNTAVLICSSFTMALAVWSAEVGNERFIALFLILTMIIGATASESFQCGLPYDCRKLFGRIPYAHRSRRTVLAFHRYSLGISLRNLLYSGVALQMKQPIVSRKTYAFTWLALLALALTTTLIGFINLGPFNMIIAITIATAKACLIASFFMHALYENKVVRVVLAGGVLWFLIMVSLTLGDYMTRGWLPFPGK